jgi:hypothetical protein
MSDGRWRTAFASVIGTSHTKTGSPCQDAGRCRVVTGLDGIEVLVAAVSDGAGTAIRSEAGSDLAVTMFLERFGDAAARDATLASIDKEFASDWLTAVRASIADLAYEEGHEVRDYSCTLLAAVVSPSASVYLQIGDGAIVVSGEEPDEYHWIFWPQHGEYANTTNFITQEDVTEALAFETGGPVREIAIFSDGIERLVLDLSAHTVHSPAFVPIFKWLAGTEPNREETPSPALVTYLSSQHVNNRTDDDKTLVMATRV